MGAIFERMEGRLDEARLPYFKMNEMARQPDIAESFYRLIEEHQIKCAVGCVINTKELVDVERSVNFPSYVSNQNRATNPYFCGVRYIVGSVAKYQKNIGINEPIEFIFDDEQEKKKIKRIWGLIKASAELSIGAMIGEAPRYL